jgi:hypothetical protein
MAVCPICQAEFESVLPGRLCDRCAAQVIARDVYTPANLRFVSILAGVLGAAILSMPGAFAGYYLGLAFDRASAGCMAGMVVMALIGIVVGSIVGRTLCLRMEAARREQAE